MPKDENPHFLCADVNSILTIFFLLLFSDNFIEGQLPDEITKLKDLRYLKIDDNFMYSTLPMDLGNMKDLEILMVNGKSYHNARKREYTFSIDKINFATSICPALLQSRKLNVRTGT